MATEAADERQLLHFPTDNLVIYCPQDHRPHTERHYSQSSCNLLDPFCLHDDANNNTSSAVTTPSASSSPRARKQQYYNQTPVRPPTSRSLAASVILNRATRYKTADTSNADQFPFFTTAVTAWPSVPDSCTCIVRGARGTCARPSCTSKQDSLLYEHDSTMSTTPASVRSSDGAFPYHEEFPSTDLSLLLRSGSDRGSETPPHLPTVLEILAKMAGDGGEEELRSRHSGGNHLHNLRQQKIALGEKLVDRSASIIANVTAKSSRPHILLNKQSGSGLDGNTSSEISSDGLNTNILIFDWDDTLCPSTWLGLLPNDVTRLPLDAKRKLDHLSTLVAETMRLAMRLGTVIIVTNAEEGWIELSCKAFMPSLHSLLSSLRKLSARTKYEYLSDNDDPFVWKQRAFHDEVAAHFYNCEAASAAKSIISIGDSAHERLALLSVTRLIPFSKDGIDVLRMPLSGFQKNPFLNDCLRECHSKSIKFMERPSIEELIQEHELMQQSLESVVNHQGDLDLCMSTSNNHGTIVGKCKF